MRVFVTGAAGYIGSAVCAELMGHGHEVVGLARSDQNAAVLDAAGIEVHRGSLEDLDSLQRGALNADGVIHLAFQNIGPQTDFMAAAAQDLAAVQAMGSVLEHTNKPFVNTSGTLLLSFLGREGTEDDVLDSSLPRVGGENVTIDLAQRGVRSSVIRLAPSVHGHGDLHGFVPSLIDMARTKGFSAYVGDGANRWTGRRTLVSTRARVRSRGNAAPRCRRVRHCVQGHRHGNRPRTRPTGQEHRARRSRRALQFPRHVRRVRQSNVQRVDSRAIGLGTQPPRAHRGHQRRFLLRKALATRRHTAPSRREGLSVPRAPRAPGSANSARIGSRPSPSRVP